MDYGPYLVQKYIKMNPLSLINIDVIRKLNQQDLYDLIKNDAPQKNIKKIYHSSNRMSSLSFQKLSNFSNFFVQKNARDFQRDKSMDDPKLSDNIKFKDSTNKRRREGREARENKLKNMENVFGFEDRALPLDYEVIRNTILLKYPKLNISFEDYREKYDRMMVKPRIY